MSTQGGPQSTPLLYRSRLRLLGEMFEGLILGADPVRSWSIYHAEAGGQGCRQRPDGLTRVRTRFIGDFPTP